MINSILSFGIPGPIELPIILIFFGTPILLIVLVVRHILRNNKERRKPRLDVGKLADELEKVRKQKEVNAKGDSSDKSG